MRSSSGKKPKALIINNYITSLKSSKIPSVNIQVFCRFKPLTQEESEQENEINLKNDNQSITLNQPNQINLCIDNKKDLKENYNFEAIFDENNSKEEIYTLSCKEIVNKVLQGYNGALICFGQTGMGKTFTINDLLGQIGNHIFNEIEKVANVNNLFKVEVAGFEIFKEQINDTLDLINLNLNLKENKNKRTFVDNLTFFSVLDAEDFVDIVSKALFKRNNTSLSMKEYTSRCNNIIVVNVYRYTKEKKQLRTGCLYLVDLEGSEKMTKNKIEGVSHEEKKILNKSLQALRHLVQTLNVIKKESLTMSTYIPYRESKLTQILCDCFGGNCYTSMILNCSLSSLYFEETRNTLLFGQSVKNILNKPKENVENNADKNPIVLEMLALYMESMKNKKSKEENKVIKKLENEILALKKQIKELENENHNNIITNSKLKETEKQLNSIKKENELNFNELKNLQNKNKELLDIIKNKEDEIKQLKSSNKNNISQNSINIEGDEEYEEDSEGGHGQYTGEGGKAKNKKNIIQELKKELKIKENIINEKDKEISEFKLINNQLIQDNTIKQEKIEELMENSQQESFLLTLDNLKQEIKEHKKTISDLSNKNKELNNLLKSSNIPNSNKYLKKNKFEKAKLEIGDEFENNNNYHSENRPDNNRLSRISGITTTSAGLTDNEKIIKYKSKIKEYKEQINSDLIQMNTLKEEIKKLNNKLKHPIFENFEKFLNLFDIAFSDYKPSKKEQKEAFEEINQKFMINNIINI